MSKDGISPARDPDEMVDRAKELLRENKAERESDEGADFRQVSPTRERSFGNDPERQEQRMDDGTDIDEQVGPDAREAKEVDYLSRHREKMDNDELAAFLRGDSNFHGALEDADWDRFSRWEERVLIQRHNSASPSELAEELEREEDVVRAKLKLMGLDRDDPR